MGLEGEGRQRSSPSPPFPDSPSSLNSFSSAFHRTTFCNSLRSIESLSLLRRSFHLKRIGVMVSSRPSNQMEVPGVNADEHRGSSSTTSTSNQQHQSIRYTGNNQFSASNFFHAPLSTFREYTGRSRTSGPSHSESSDSSINDGLTQNNFSGPGNNHGEVSIMIIDGEEQEHRDDVSVQPISGTDSTVVLDAQGHSRILGVEASDGGGVNDTRNSPNQTARWIEQILPFSSLLLLVFIQQHLQGFLLTIWIAGFMFKSNDILQKQTALKGERKISVLMSVSVFLTLDVAGVYWWYRMDDLLYPLLMLPPKRIPPFWHALFLIVVNDILVRQAAMVVKCFVLMYYKNIRGGNYRKQGEVLTLVEYLLVVYRAMLPSPVWYRFFLNKEYGRIFSLLVTGLYLTFKLTFFVQKVQYLFSAVKVLSHKAIHYGTYATNEQVNAGGDVCAICQEKMHAPLMLRCKHIFCEECVSEWLERERTCPLCRAVVKSENVRSFVDGSTSLFFQLF
ncbi:hypothetical protein L2E82_01267 [Cichorium intybus]|uniref:Uncharacterized protein n=1 Tax=Cichorium intybus TaxID=13427 RepID=A0ACB9GY38_CICIN|nr:hypothetical protein L2E82_01267 [Cichorium intybus]